MSLIIYFLRHGGTNASQTGGYCGTLDPDLTPEGYQMAEDFADAYKSLPWVAVFSSPLRRAVARPNLFARRQEYECNSRKG